MRSSLTFSHNYDRNIKLAIWEYSERIKSRRLYNWLSRDNLIGVVVSGGVFHFETATRSPMPDYIRDTLVKFIKNNFNLKYLYE